MTRASVALMLAPLWCCAALVAAAAEQRLPAALENWEWLREDPAGWRVAGDVLELRAQGRRIWSGDGATNLLLAPGEAGGRSVTVDVTHGDPQTKYEQGGLLVYRDDDHFVKLILEFIDGEYFIVMAREVGAAGRVFTKEKVANKSARLRLAVEGERVVASFAEPGSGEFQPAGECELPGAAAARFALFTQDGSDEDVRWIRFARAELAPVPAARGAFETRQLSDEFHAEGAAIGDLNNDGAVDLVYGPFWFEGPRFERRHVIYKPNRFAVATYSNNFMPYVEDLDGDGWRDVLVLGFPGRDEATYWLRNPGDSGGEWRKHVVFRGPGNESPTWADVDGDGRNEVVCSIDGRFALLRPEPGAAHEPWSMQPISPPGSTGGFFTHGLGLGDVDGDGLLDLLEKTGWWQQVRGEGALWRKHPYPFSSAGGAQMFAYDFDGDGDNDVVTSLNAHGYGLAWFEQVEAPGGGIGFERHVIMGSEPGQSDYGVAFSGLHGMALADVDGDGVADLVTGKRYWAHAGNDPGGREPPVIYWFRTVRGAGAGAVEFVPHLIHGDSGVGTVVNTGDLDGDGDLDIAIGNKKGCFIHLQSEAAPVAAPRVGRTPPPAAAEGVVRLEGEEMQVLAASAGRAVPQAMGGFGAGVWSGDAQLWWLDGEPGALLELAVPVREAGFYRLAAAFTKAVDYGVFELSIDGRTLTRGHDFFQAEGVSHSGRVELGAVRLDAGVHRLQVRVTGAHPDAIKRYMFGLDYLSLEEVETEPQVLFDGVSLDGWQGNAELWRVEDGAISAAIAEGDTLGRNEFLWWEGGELHDFELRLRFRITGGPSANSGVQVRSHKSADGHAVGYQADLDHGDTWTGRIYDEHGRGLIAERGARVTIGAAGAREVEQVRPPGDFAVLVRRGEWNDYMVRALGATLQTWVNGELCAELTDHQFGEHEFSGLLALQMHSGPGPARVEFTDIVLLPLGKTPPPEPPPADPNG